MKFNKILLFLLTTLWVSAGYCANHHVSANLSPSCIKNKTTCSQKMLNVYFVQNALSGNIKVLNKKRGIYKLTLKQFSPIVVYFCDRPQRNVHAITINKLLRTWKEGNNSLKNNPPNASLSAVTLNVAQGIKTLDLFLALKNPQYNAKKQILTYTAYNLDHSTQIPDTKHFQNVTLFIDSLSFCASCT